jgi:nucleotide-binding universal stress UspA family protein
MSRPAARRNARANTKRPSSRIYIVELAESYQLELRTTVRADVAAEEAILKELARGKHNLIVMGVGRRPGEKLFFGDTAAALLEKSERSLLLVAS